jgi:uncharacterized protein
MGYKEFRNLNAIGFNTNLYFYIYDSFSNEILRVEPVILDVLDDSFELSKEQIVEKHTSRWPKREIIKALDSIAEVQRAKKALLSFMIPQFSISPHGTTMDWLTHKLNSQLTQLILNVTENCNLRCEYCVYSGNYVNRRKHNTSNDITVGLAKKAIDFFSAHSQGSDERYLSLYGGEPFLRFGFVREMIEYAKRKDSNINIAVTTNGVLLSETIVGFLARHDVALTISLDGPKELHDRYRVFQNGKGTFDLVMNGIQLIKEKFPTFYATKVKINSVVAPYKGEIEEINRFFNSSIFAFAKRPQKYSVGLVNPQENRFVEKYEYYAYTQKYFSIMFRRFMESHIDADNLLDIPVASALLSKEMKMLYLRSGRRLPEYHLYWPNGICIPGMRSLFVSADGKFYPCEKLYDYDDMAIGDIQSGFDVSRIGRFIDQYCDMTIDNCRRCWAYRLCSECFLTIRGNGSWDATKRREFCVGQRNMWTCVLVVYVAILENNDNAFDYFTDEVRGEGGEF